MAILFAMTGNELLAQDLANLTTSELGEIQLRSFPDGETYVRVLTDVKDRDVFLVCTLARPNAKFLELAFTAATVRRLGAASVRLIAPYLAYMRQDRIFNPGEALTSSIFADLLQNQFDELITVDPHLHRHASLGEVYRISTKVIHSAPLFADWVATNVQVPVLIGPDEESSQWVKSIAEQCGAPWGVFRKDRHGANMVRMQGEDLTRFRGRTPVLVDDIVSSGGTMREAMRILRNEGFASPYCLAIHALCGSRTARHIRDRATAFLTTNSVPNPDAAFDLAPIIAQGLIESAAGAKDCRKIRRNA